METTLKRPAWRPAAIIISLMLAVLTLAATSTSASASDGGTTGTGLRPDGTRITATAAPATVTPQDNEGAWVSGVGQCDINQARDCWTWVNTSTGTPCPSSHFCIYTNDTLAEGGKVFSFYHCTNGGSEWALQNWTGYGFYSNSNSGGAHALIKDVNHRTLPGGDIPPYPANGYHGSFYFRPAWFIRAC
ncbi:hypothetical protein [Flindersiella endophytica]